VFVIWLSTLKREYKMPNFEYDPRMYPYGPLTMGGRRVAFIPELRALECNDEDLPMEIIVKVCDKLNAGFAYGMRKDEIEGEFAGLVEQAMQAL
jgi:hypothetical protein